MKTLWDIHENKNTLWIKWIHEVYLRRRSVWEWSCGRDDPLLVAAAIELMKSRSSNGILSTAKAYDWLRTKIEAKPWMSSLIWKQYILPKYSFILWLGMWDRLYTTDKWVVEVDDKRCSFCKRHLETTNHLFFHCTFVQAVWSKVQGWLGISRRMDTLKSSVKWIKKDFRGGLIKTKAITLAFAATVYLIWKSRNEAVFAMKKAEVPSVFFFLLFNEMRILLMDTLKSSVKCVYYFLSLFYW